MFGKGVIRRHGNMSTLTDIELTGPPIMTLTHGMQLGTLEMNLGPISRVTFRVTSRADL